MSNIRIKAMEIANFKGIKNLSVNFNETTTFISGANGVGKSSIYDAYMWCLFNKNQQGKEQNVQPLDKDNEPIHKLVTSVMVVLDVDGIESSIRREQREDWQVPRGTSVEVLKGRKQERYINEVPYGVGEFNTKISSLFSCDMQHIFMLSSVSAFMDIEQDKRRKLLQSLSGELNDMDIAVNYPSVLKALQEGKSLEELKRLTKSVKSTAQRNLDEIPARIDQQERLRVNIDTTMVEKQKQDAIKMRDELTLELQEHQQKRPSDSSSEYASQLAMCNNKIYQLTSKHEDEYNKDMYENKKEIKKLQLDVANSRQTIANNKSRIDKLENGIQLQNQLIQGAKERWEIVNNRTFCDDVKEVCPVCGQALPEDKVLEARKNAIKEFNEKKVRELNEAIESGKRHAADRDNLFSQAEELKEEITTHETSIDVYELRISSLIDEQSKIVSVEDRLANDAEYVKLIDEKASINQAMDEATKGTNAVIAEYNNKTNELMASIRAYDDIVSQCASELASVATNGRIDQEKERLEELARNLSQTIAECDMIEYELSSFKKAKISIVEDRVSSLFEIVRWKMYEPNLTNDGEKEICQAVIDGIPYEQTNTAMKINAGVDIVNGISKALGINCPLFVDNAESVTNIRSTQSQLITLTVVEGQELTIL